MNVEEKIRRQSRRARFAAEQILELAHAQHADDFVVALEPHIFR